MKKNMSATDRIFRFVAVLAVAVLYFTEAISGPIALGLMVVAAILLITSFTGVCPLYSLFRVRTKKDVK